MATAIAKGSNSNAEKHDAKDCPLYCDSVEFCPIQNYCQLFLCGNYQLFEDTRIKKGHVFLLENKDNRFVM